NNQRYYDPTTGRYLTCDPLGLAPTPNPYTYVRNPYISADPLGLAPCGTEVPALEAGLPGSVVPNALEPHELAQAQSIVDLQGGTFIGNTLKSAPGIDGTLDGVPVSLKAYSGSSPVGVLRHASAAELSARNAGYSGVGLYIDAPNVPMSRLLDFGRHSPLNLIPKQGIINTIYVKTAGGWVVFPG
ncbi:MAG TPA: RHS repeat-associated core domain-containing protein, partial [Streptosporangiaceae bacterium]|nr:RHS repeat-associated core domain-containing protein [Streptosporangiaceae bacterium]